jgi:glycosyltransferase involved in cell wall biosynthesis
MATVFIGIPTRNRPLLVQETVKSVLAQTYHQYQVVVSDNQSDPDAARTVEAFIQGLNDDRFRYVRQEQNGGEYGQGRYFFHASAECPFLTMLHDDDVINPDYLATALNVLEKRPSLAFFVANPFLMDLDGRPAPRDTAKYLRDHGRTAKDEGPFDVLSAHMACGFTPISGTLFRRSALENAGFVDGDCHGNFPFECNVFLRLGEHGAQAWFSPEELLGFRFHPASLRNSLQLMDNRLVVDTMIRILARRRFDGRNERRRRIMLGRLYRAKALIVLRDGQTATARHYLKRALRENARSVRAWALAPWLLVMPWPLRRVLPALPQHWEPPHASGLVAGTGVNVVTGRE